ncbi:MAG: response regulator [Mucilaginibacter sp.]
MCSLFVLEDDLVQQYILKANLARYSIFEDITYYENGSPLIDYLHANKTDPECLPDMMFVDLEMPGVNGWKVLDELDKLNNSLCKQVIVYIITASISLSDRMRALKYDFVREFISKPVTKQTYMEISRDAEKMACEDAEMRA